MSFVGMANDFCASLYILCFFDLFILFNFYSFHSFGLRSSWARVANVTCRFNSMSAGPDSPNACVCQYFCFWKRRVSKPLCWYICEVLLFVVANLSWLNCSTGQVELCILQHFSPGNSSFYLGSKIKQRSWIRNISADVPDLAGATPATTAAPEAASAPAGLLIFFHGALKILV